VNFSNRGIASLILEVLIFKCKLKDYRYNSLSAFFQKRSISKATLPRTPPVPSCSASPFPLSQQMSNSATLIQTMIEFGVQHVVRSSVLLNSAGGGGKINSYLTLPEQSSTPNSSEEKRLSTLSASAVTTPANTTRAVIAMIVEGLSKGVYGCGLIAKFVCPSSSPLTYQQMFGFYLFDAHLFPIVKPYILRFGGKACAWYHLPRTNNGARLGSDHSSAGVEQKTSEDAFRSRTNYSFGFKWFLLVGSFILFGLFSFWLVMTFGRATTTDGSRGTRHRQTGPHSAWRGHDGP